MTRATSKTNEKQAYQIDAKNWELAFRSALTHAAKEAGFDVSSVKWERCTTDNTWGDRCGLVFFGASDEINERCAKYFLNWASKNLRKAGVVGGYDTQESISFAGAMFFTRYDNGANGWHKPIFNKYDIDAMTVTTDYGSVSHPIEMKKGFATSYVYYPCAD
jgi:hypothetical protein